MAAEYVAGAEAPPAHAPAGAEVRTSAGERFPLVDSMRAIAALCVLAFHVSLQRHIPAFAGRYVGNLGLFGVTVFFLISGFVLYRPFLAARVEGREPSERDYAIRRIARIVPAYWVALTLVTLFGHGAATVKEHPFAYYGFAQIYSANTIFGGIGQAWTLCVEMTFYIFLPLWALAMAWGGAGTRRGWRWETGALVVLAIVSIIWILGFPPQGAVVGHRPPQPSWLPRFFLEFAAGMGLALLSVRLRRGGGHPRFVDPLFGNPAMAWVGVPIFYFAAVHAHPGGLRDLCETAAAACLLWPAIFSASGRGVAGSLLAWRPLIFAGTVSYGIYLYHYAIITRLAPHLESVHGSAGTLALLVLAIAGAVFVGWLSWVFVERPAMLWARRRTSRGGRSGAVRGV
jgi:peptidoglycan/LPS O-acetylase OafA/YrhL